MKLTPEILAKRSSLFSTLRELRRIPVLVAWCPEEAIERPPPSFSLEEALTIEHRSWDKPK